MSDGNHKRGLSLEEIQPEYDDPSKQPKTLTRTRHIDGALYVAGRAPIEGQTEYDIMFITVSVDEDEATEHATTTFGMRLKQPAEYLKGGNGIIKDVALGAGVDIDTCYYTAVCKWLLPRATRARPPKKVMRWGMPILEDEIKRVKPKIIVCMGKHAFDMVADQKISFKDAHGCWFWSEEHEAHLYVMHAPYTLVGKPEFYEMFRVDFKEVARRKALLDAGGSISGEEVKYQVINNESDLLDWLDHIEDLASPGEYLVEGETKWRPGEDRWPGHRDNDGNPLLAVDCEWHGVTHVDGQLRTMQIAWSETDAVVIEFRNEQNEWSFEGLEPEEKVGGVLTPPHPSLREDGSYPLEDFKRDVAAVDLEPLIGDGKSRRNVDTAPRTIPFDPENVPDAYHSMPAMDPVLHYGKTPPEGEEGWDEIDDGVWQHKTAKAFSMKFLSAEACVVCGGKDCEHLKTNKNGDSFDQSAMREALKKFVGKPVTADLKHEIMDTVRQHMPPTAPVVSEVKQVGDRLLMEISSLSKENVEEAAKAASNYTRLCMGRPTGGFAEGPTTMAGNKPADRVSENLEDHYEVGPIEVIERDGGVVAEVLITPHDGHDPYHIVSQHFTPAGEKARKHAVTDVEHALEELKSHSKSDAEIAAKGSQMVRAGAKAVMDKAQAEHEHRKYLAVGKPIASTFERMNVRFIGHHYAADAPWMNHKLGIEIYERCALDTEFAQQTVDESSELGLERGIAMKYTSLGRYDYDLMMWKRENKKLCEGGYGFIPSSILYPYGAKDVIAPYRAYPMIKRQLEAQRLWDYYKDTFNPFVTDVFTQFTTIGLPMDIPLLNDLRSLLTFTKDKLNAKLQERIASEARNKFTNRVIKEFGIKTLVLRIPNVSPGPPVKAEESLDETFKGQLVEFNDPTIKELIDNRDEENLTRAIKMLLSENDRLKDVPDWKQWIHHLVESPNFNIRSPQQMARWLFDFEGLTPIKSTNQKAKGLPSMAWEKVLELPPDRQKLYMPAVDKQTLSILAEQLPTIDELLNLNAVGNLSKAFLKEPDVYIDPETGEEVVSENGIHQWIASDGRLHNQYSGTETGRPRAWMPNVLNYPAYVNMRVSLSVAKCIKEAHEEGDLPEHLMKWVGMSADDLPSIRSCIKVPEGWILVESDYATAEMVALAVISGDPDLSRILFEPDPDWALLDPDSPANPYGKGAVRVHFSDEETTGIPAEAHNPEYLMHFWDEDKVEGIVNRGPVTEDMLQKNPDGSIKHAKFDIHWSLIERTYGKCREIMKAKVDRAAAKVLNFSSAYGASAGSLERKIESDTGVKPDEGTGEAGLEAIAERQPRATQFLEEMARVPKEKGFYRAASGRIRHCLMHKAGSGVGWRTRNSIESALGREMRNFPMQESVGATSARACRWLLKAYRKLGIEARPMTCLYDSVVTLCPIEERHLVARLHDMFMSDRNKWEYQDDRGVRTLQYTIDNEFNYRWSTRPSKEEQEKLETKEYHPADGKVKRLEDFASLDMLVS